MLSQNFRCPMDSRLRGNDSELVSLMLNYGRPK